MTTLAKSLPRRWMSANTLALLFGYVLYTPIAHGLGGDHPQGLNAFQILTHSIVLAVVAVFVAAAQRHVLSPYISIPYISIPMTRFPLAAVAFIAAFWAGAYQPWLRGPDFDILFGSFVLGSAAFLGLLPIGRDPLASSAALLAFPVGCFLGQLIILAVVETLGVVPNLQSSRLRHSVYWISVGVSMGVALVLRLIEVTLDSGMRLSAPIVHSS